MIHRYLATGVGVLLVVLALASWRLRRHGRPGPVSPWWPTLTLLWVCVQGAFGALTVTLKLLPAIVTLHLLGGLVLLALLSGQAVRYAQHASGAPALAVGGGLRALLGVSWVLLVLQVTLGGWVSTNYAVLACSDFPRCQNSWWPPMDFQQGFEPWRELGLTGSGVPISFAALTAIHYMHRLLALLLLTLLGVLAWRLNQVAALHRPARWLGALIGLQLATGLSTVVLGWPLLAAVLHTGGAGALVMVMTWALAASHTRRFVPAPAGLTSPDTRSPA